MPCWRAPFLLEALPDAHRSSSDRVKHVEWRRLPSDANKRPSISEPSITIAEAQANGHKWERVLFRLDLQTGVLSQMTLQETRYYLLETARSEWSKLHAT